MLLLLAALAAPADLVGPYTPDANTLHLWHLDETTTPAVDSATAGINLSGLLSGATLGTASYAGFGSALNTLDGGQDAIATGTRDALLAVSASAGNVSVTYADPTTGAFTNAFDGNLANFWVSYGTNAGQGPAPSHPEWLQVTFPRQVAVSEFQIYPRSDNDGYGPKDTQLLLDGILAFQGTMAPTSTLDVRLSPPVNATNAQLLITSSYDRGSSTNPRNVQVDEMSFFERALPGTYGDWALHTFTDAQLADSALGTATADADRDGVPNLVEFAMGGNPFVSDASVAALQMVTAEPGAFAFTFRERKSLGDVQRRFETSTNLVYWEEVSPASLLTVANLPDVYVREAVFPAQNAVSFFRVKFSLSPGG
jgi:hypothetical protein